MNTKQRFACIWDATEDKLGKFGDRDLKISRDFLASLDGKLAADGEQMNTIAEDFEPRRKQIEVKEAQERAEQQEIESALARQQSVERAQHQKDAADARAREARYQAAVEEKQRQCGGELGRPRIGMSRALLLQCVSLLQLVSETNRSDGVLATYIRPDGMHVLVLDGRVVSWSR